MMSVIFRLRNGVPVHQGYKRLLGYPGIVTTLSTSSSRLALKSAEGVGHRDDNQGLDYETRNKRLNRPLSPHLSIYKYHNNMVQSITNRITGMALAGMLYSFGLGAMLLPGSYPYYLENWVAVLDAWTIFGIKLIVALPFCYHSINGIRHLFWDAGFWWGVKEVNKTGNVVVSLSLIIAFLLALL